MSEKYEKLKGLLKELFQLDQPDLDFGLYRIMHAKSVEVTQFLEKDLLPQVKAAFTQYQPADRALLQKELNELKAGIEKAGMDPAQSPKVQELEKRLKDDAVDLNSLENEIYDRLYSFFRRYYSEGDFLAKRVYKPGVYAIPYEGEEVTLHWANKDQYYIKTSEYLRDYAFRLRPDDDKKPLRVHFRLVDATEGEHGNVKAAEGKDRVFILAAAGESRRDFIAEENGELTIRFEYRPATLTDWPEDMRDGKTKPPAQKDLTALAVNSVLAVTDPALTPWIAELDRPHPIANGEKADYCRLDAHLRRYTARNTFDYFIHKDLGNFLRRELDFYIKNEVMHLDDVENESAPKVEQHLSKIKVIRKIAGKIIAFLAQLEDFQKGMWLKKKFVVETSYCITLDRIPEAFYPEIAVNDAQREEWVRLFVIDEIKGDLTTPGYSAPLTVEFLKAQPTLVVDTRHFNADLTAPLLQAMGDMEEQTAGLLVHGENFQALSLLQRRYRQQVKCIYIDPPYNTDATEIIYKNGYKNSSWLSLISDRLLVGRLLLSPKGVHCLTIDDYEHALVRGVLEEEFGSDNYLATVLIRNNPSGRSTVKGFSINHEFALFFSNNPNSANVGRLPHSEEQKDRYNLKDGNGDYEWENFRKSSAGSDRASRSKQHFPLFVHRESMAIRVPRCEWKENTKAYTVLDAPMADEVVIYPLDEQGREKVWRWGLARTVKQLLSLEARRVGSRVEIYGRKYLNPQGVLPRTWWDKPEYSARDNGTRTLRDLFAFDTGFDFPKAVDAVADSIRIGCSTDEGIVLDYFGGSGTSGQAVIQLNREDGGTRQFVLVEMGEHFDTVLLPRIKKVTFTPEWKDGKPKRPATPEESEHGPHIVKVIRLESYEDVLNNLDLRRTKQQQTLLDAAEAQDADGLKEQYLLRYLLDVETRGSQSLLNIAAFTDPTAYTLKVKRPGSDENRNVNVDLLETFNYLIGLNVWHLAAPQTFTAEFERDSEKRLRLKGRLKQDAASPWWFRTVTGITPDGLKTLVIWRKRPGGETADGIEQDNLVLDEWFTKQGYSTKDYEFQLIYVNGDNNLENLKAPDDTWKVRLIEDDFHRLMFDTEGV